MNEEGSIEGKHRLIYRFDKYLMFLVQDVTKRQPAEILNFFYELGAALSQASLKGVKQSQRNVKRSATDYFPGSAIPFHVIVKGNKYRIYDDRTHKYGDDETWSFTIEAGFPDETSPMPEEELKRINLELMENALFDAEHEVVAPMFVKPEIRSSHGFRKLMTSFMGREPEPKKPRKKREKKDGSATPAT